METMTSETKTKQIGKCKRKTGNCKLRNKIYKMKTEKGQIEKITKKI